MKVNGDESFRFLGAYLTRAKEASERSSTRTIGRRDGGVADTVEISGLAKHLKDFTRVVSSVSDVNSARVDEVRRKINTGEYRVQSESLAEDLIRRAIIERLL